MPTYLFRCADGCQFDAVHPMSAVPAQLPCPDCGGTARRIPTAPHLARTSSSAFQLMDRTARSAHEPDVVQSLPARAGRPTATRTTTNPLHSKLPRS